MQDSQVLSNVLRKKIKSGESELTIDNDAIVVVDKDGSQYIVPKELESELKPKQIKEVKVEEIKEEIISKPKKVKKTK